MIPLYSREQRRTADRLWTERHPERFLDRMLEVGRELGERVAQRCGDTRIPIGVFCGPGHNGGDGLRMALRLRELGYSVQVWLIDRHRMRHPEFAQWAADLGGRDFSLSSMEDIGIGLGIDAVLGLGQDRRVQGVYQEFVQWANGSGYPFWAVDQPTGWYAEADEVPASRMEFVRTTGCYCIGAPPIGLLVSAQFFGGLDWEVIPLEQDEDFVRETKIVYGLSEPSDFLGALPPYPHFSSKSDRGKVVVCAGSDAMPGALALVARSALRSGAGRVWGQSSDAVRSMLAGSLPELMWWSEEQAYPEEGVLVIGPGMGRTEAAEARVRRALENSPERAVIDADALYWLGQWGHKSPPLRSGCILTPHWGEFDRWYPNPPRSGFERLERGRRRSAENGCVLVLKGAYTAVCLPDGTVYFNPSGNPILGIPGSGDVLSGLMGGLLAQGLSPEFAARCAAYVHGRAGDRLKAQRGERGILATELADALGEVFRELGE
ncbi:NAD(P)H-hydrate dehydratase [bacterium]|nr:NAD(P)H-hydrate dehydratase [bacterium]